MSEASIRQRGRELLLKQGWLPIALVAGPEAGKGWPDTVGVAEGHFFAVEWKDWNGGVEPIQWFRLRCIRKAGGCGFVTDDPELAVAAIGDFAMMGTMPPIDLRRRTVDQDR